MKNLTPEQTNFIQDVGAFTERATLGVYVAIGLFILAISLVAYVIYRGEGDRG